MIERMERLITGDFDFENVFISLFTVLQTNFIFSDALTQKQHVGVKN